MDSPKGGQRANLMKKSSSFIFSPNARKGFLDSFTQKKSPTENRSSSRLSTNIPDELNSQRELKKSPSKTIDRSNSMPEVDKEKDTISLTEEEDQEMLMSARKVRYSEKLENKDMTEAAALRKEVASVNAQLKEVLAVVQRLQAQVATLQAARLDDAILLDKLRQLLPDSLDKPSSSDSQSKQGNQSDSDSESSSSCSDDEEDIDLQDLTEDPALSYQNSDSMDSNQPPEITLEPIDKPLSARLGRLKAHRNVTLFGGSPVLKSWLDHMTQDSIPPRYKLPSCSTAIAIIQAGMRGAAARSWKKRTQVVQEFVTTEENYVRSLQTAIDVFLSPIKKSKLLGQSDMEAIFSELEWLCFIHRQFLYKVREQYATWLSSQIFSSVIINETDFLEGYTKYINNYNLAIITLNQHKQSNPAFATLLKKCESNPAAHYHDLQSFLLQPIQRIPRYALLLRDLIKKLPETHVDYEGLTTALQKIDFVAELLNERKRDADHLAEVVALQTKLVGPKAADFASSNPKRIVKKGALSLKKRWNSENVMGFLLDNQLLICKPSKKNGLLLWKVKERAPLVSLIDCCLSPETQRDLANPSLTTSVSSSSSPSSTSIHNPTPSSPSPTPLSPTPTSSAHVEESQSQVEPEFYVSTGSKKLIFSTETSREADEWVKEILKSAASRTKHFPQVPRATLNKFTVPNSAAKPHSSVKINTLHFKEEVGPVSKSSIGTVTERETSPRARRPSLSVHRAPVSITELLGTSTSISTPNANANPLAIHSSPISSPLSSSPVFSSNSPTLSSPQNHSPTNANTKSTRPKSTRNSIQIDMFSPPYDSPILRSASIASNDRGPFQDLNLNPNSIAGDDLGSMSVPTTSLISNRPSINYHGPTPVASPITSPPNGREKGRDGGHGRTSGGSYIVSGTFGSSSRTKRSNRLSSREDNKNREL